MNILYLYLFLFATAVFPTNNLQAQHAENQLKIQKIYDALHKKSNSPQDVAALTPAIKWQKLKIPDDVNPRNTITMCAIMKDQWASIMFRDLQIDQIDEDQVIVTGVVNGRQPSECEYISTRFKHYWFFGNGEIITFSEKSIDFF